MYPPGPADFNVGTAFSYGWKKFSENAGPIIVAIVVLFVGELVFSLIGSSIARGMATVGGNPLYNGATMVSLLFNVLGWVVGTIVAAVVIRGALDLTEGRPLSLGAVTSSIDFAQVILAALIVGALTFVGLLLCFLPGLVIAFLTWFAPFFVVGKAMKATDAVGASIKFVSANLGAMIVLLLASIGVFLLGAIVCGVGLIVAYPVILIANTYAFRVLNGDPVAP